MDIKITGATPPHYQNILSPDAIAFVANLAQKFEPRRQELLAERKKRSQRLAQGERLDFLVATQKIRDAEWKVAPVAQDLQQRRVEITGPAERKMVINALNSGADGYMCDFEDSNTPSWDNQIQGQINVFDAVRRTIRLDSQGKIYQLNDKTATLLIRPRGWHLDEKHMQVDGRRLSGSLFDFGLFIFHNGLELIKRGSGPYFYLPKMESHVEARLWNDVFVHAQKELNMPQRTIKATVLIETILAAFEMDEILYELREHSAGLNAGRWDYIFSCIKKFSADKDFCLANRGLITMTAPFMRAYALLLLKTCHRRGAHAMGGMSALIPIKNDAEANARALAGVRADKKRDAEDGYDGGWVAHPGLVEPAREEWDRVLNGKPNQIDKQRMDVQVSAADLTNFAPSSPVTEAGLRNNISVGIQYLGSWLSGNGCVPIFNLMEDAATAEISRSQVWQWIKSPKGVLDDGRRITVELVNQLMSEEMEKILAESATNLHSYYKQAQDIFRHLVEDKQFTEFLTLPLYEELA